MKIVEVPNVSVFNPGTLVKKQCGGEEKVVAARRSAEDVLAE
jgi:hypothetical protein